MSSKFPVITEMLVIPVAGYDSMLLSLSGAHGPFFTRNVVILKDNSGNTGVGRSMEGGHITRALEKSILVVGKPISEYRKVLEDSARYS